MQAVVRSSKLMLWCCVFAWALILGCTIYDSIAMPDQYVVSGVDVVSDLIIRQTVFYIWIAVGLGLSVLGLWRSNWRSAATCVSALTYLLVWYWKGPMRLVGPFDGYRLLWQMATELDLYFSFFVRDVLAPVLFLVAGVAGAISILRRH